MHQQGMFTFTSGTLVTVFSFKKIRFFRFLVDDKSFSSDYICLGASLTAVLDAHASEDLIQSRLLCV